MGYEFTIALRYLRSRRTAAFLSMITIIAIGGVMLGVAALCAVLSVMSGFEEDLKKKILGANAHIVVTKYGDDFVEYDEVREKMLQVQGVLGGSPFIQQEVMVSSETNMTGAMIKGIDLATVGTVTDLPENVKEGQLEAMRRDVPVQKPKRLRPGFVIDLEDLDEDPPPKASAKPALPDWAGGAQDAPEDDDGEWPTERDVPDLLEDGTPAPDPITGRGPLAGIAIGREMARNLRVGLGDRLTVTSPLGGEIGPMGPIPRSRNFEVAAIFHSGMYEYDTKSVYITLGEAQDFFKLGGTVRGVELKVQDIYSTEGMTDEIRDLLGNYPYNAMDWRQMNRNLFSALKLEKMVMFILLLLVVLVASFNILSTLIMTVLTRGKEIAIIKSMGADRRGILRIFLWEGLIIGGIGTSLGLVLGFVLCIAISKISIGLDQDVYYIDKLPVLMNPVEFLVVGVSALIISLLVTVPAAYIGASLKPVDGLRYE